MNNDKEINKQALFGIIGRYGEDKNKALSCASREACFYTLSRQILLRTWEHGKMTNDICQKIRNYFKMTRGDEKMTCVIRQMTRGNQANVTRHPTKSARLLTNVSCLSAKYACHRTNDMCHPTNDTWQSSKCHESSDKCHEFILRCQESF